MENVKEDIQNTATNVGEKINSISVNIKNKFNASFDKIKEGFKQSIDNLKEKLEIEDMSKEDISSELKNDLAELLEISADKLKNLKSSKLKFNINVDDMTIEESTVAATIEKLAQRLKQSSENEKQQNNAPNFKLVFTKELKQQIRQLDFQQGQSIIKQEIINQALAQGFSEANLNNPCTQLTNSISQQSISFNNTTFLDSLTNTIHSVIMGQNVFEKENNENIQEKETDKIQNLSQNNKSNKNKINSVETNANETDLELGM